MKRRKVIVLCFFFISLGVNSNVLLVPSPYSTIQAALNAASSGDTILVSSGVYYENIVWPNVQGLKLFSVGGSSNTHIDANHNGRPLTFNGQISLDSTTIIQGFSIRNGYVSSMPCVGGGIYIENGDIQLIELNIHSNMLSHPWDSASGGGICILNSNPLIKNTKVEYNSIIGQDARGGGLACIYSDPQIISSSFNNNYLKGTIWSIGGGMYINFESNPVISNSEFNHNYFEDSLSRYYGGGLYSATLSNPILKNVSIRSNYMGDYGTFYNGGGAYFTLGDSIVLDDVVIDSNYCSGIDGSWAYGAGLFINKGPYDKTIPVTRFFMKNVKITNNKGAFGNWSKGGGIYIDECDTVIGINLLIADNILDIDQDGYGGGIFIKDSCNLILINSTIANNKVSNIGDFYGSGLFSEYGKTTAMNCIFWNPNSLNEIVNIHSNLSASYSDILGGYSGLSNINLSPLFIGNGNYHLQSNSPCAGTGNPIGAPTFDIDNNIRPWPVGTNPDMGAYEDSTEPNLIEDNPFTSPFMIIPNPAYHKIKIIHSKNPKTKLEIFNLIGELLIQKKLFQNTTELDIGFLSPGIYFFRVSGDDWADQQKLIKK
ncbi:T9SS type A sorting domain-containing protein [candidate division KSB1 bacterium]